MKKTPYNDFWWAENHLCPEHEGYEAIIKVSPPQVLIRMKVAELHTSFEEFYKSIAEVSWFGEEPPKALQQKIFLDAWNYLALEEQILDNNLEMMETK